MVKTIVLGGEYAAVIGDPIPSSCRELSARISQVARRLPEWTLPAGGIFAVHAPGRQMQPVVRAFIDF